MSLVCWLPLNGTLENKGISNITVTNNGATVNASGKIGSCYSFAKNAYLDINKETMTSFTTAASISFWIKINSWNTNWDTIFQAGKGGTPWNNYIFGILRNQGNFLCFTVTNSSDSSSQGSYVTSNLTVGQWAHIACTYTAGKIVTYLNGIKCNEYTTSIVPNFAGITSIKVGGLASNYKCDCLLNDVRIYDHCLSAAEVKEISQGLVLHYKLDDAVGFTDLISRGGSWTIYNNHNNTNMPSTLVDTGTSYNGDKIWRETCTPTDNSLNSIKTQLYSHGVYNWRRTFSANTKYVFWIYYKPISHSDTVCGGTASNIGGWTEIPPVAVGGGWYRVGQYRNGTVTSDKTDNIFVSFKVPSATTGTPIIIDWASPHMLEGTTEIPPYDYPSTIIQDSSGYGHNGTINGTLTLSNNTPRYSGAIYGGNNTTSVVTTWDPSWLNSNQTFTCNVWINKKSQVGSDWNTIFRYANSNVKSQQLHFCYKASSILLSRYSDDISISYTIPTNQWIMLTWTGSGRSESLYINGEFKQTVTHSTDLALVSTAKLMLFKDAVRNNYGSDIMMSDFRIYCTALSADDVFSLYHTAAKVDNLGSIHTFEFQEKNNPKIYKTGITENSFFIENDSFASQDHMSYKPATGNNKCQRDIVLDFSHFVNKNIALKVRADFDVSWSNFAGQSGQTLAVYTQTANHVIETDSNDYSSNYCGGTHFESLINANSTGTTHVTKTSTIPAEWFDTHDKMFFGFRSNYSDGNGTIGISNFKYTIASQIPMQITKDYTNSKILIEK